MKLHTAAVSLVLASCAQALNGPDACYSDLGAPMRSHGKSQFQSPGLCMKVCGENGFNYAAIQDLECYCGAGLPPKENEISADHCDTECAGYPSDVCGGKDAFSLYTSDNVLELPPSYTPSRGSATSDVASSSISETGSTAISEASETKTAGSSATFSSVSGSSSPAESTTQRTSGASSESSTSTAPTSSLPSALDSSSSTGVTPISSTSGANRRYSFLF